MNVQLVGRHFFPSFHVYSSVGPNSGPAPPPMSQSGVPNGWPANSLIMCGCGWGWCQHCLSDEMATVAQRRRLFPHIHRGFFFHRGFSVPLLFKQGRGWVTNLSPIEPCYAPRGSCARRVGHIGSWPQGVPPPFCRPAPEAPGGTFHAHFLFERSARTPLRVGWTEHYSHSWGRWPGGGGALVSPSSALAELAAWDGDLRPCMRRVGLQEGGGIAISSSFPGLSLVLVGFMYLCHFLCPIGSLLFSFFLFLPSGRMASWPLPLPSPNSVSHIYPPRILC